MKKINAGICVLLSVAAVLSLSACSVGMALSGKKDPDLSVLKKGGYRCEVELQFGSPTQVAVSSGNGYTTALYNYEVGNESSPGRAVAHGAMDVLTLGLWEVVGTPVELVTGSSHQLTVTYDETDRIVSIGRTK
jgi:hypothetical protein